MMGKKRSIVKSTLQLSVLVPLSTSVLVRGLVTQPRTRRRRYGSLLFSKTPSVLCIGEALLDCISNENGMSADGMIAKEAWTVFPGGGSANTAAALSKFGIIVGYCGSVGTDDDGELLEKMFKDSGVSTELLQRCDKYPTRRVMVSRSMDGDRSFAGFHNDVAADKFSDCYLDSTRLDQERVNEILHSVDWIICGTLSLAYPQSAASILELVERGIEHGARLCVNVSWRPIFWTSPEQEARTAIMKFVKKAHIVKLTHEDAEWLVNIPAEKALEDPVSIHKQYFPHALAVLVTGGELGASYSIHELSGRIPAFNINAVETTGAGDAFLAGFLYGVILTNILDDKDDDGSMEDTIKDVVTFASAVGALTCTEEGAIAAQPTLQQVESFLIHGSKEWV